MSEKINDGGPAFPHSGFDGYGMSLRDWFAGMAMQALIAQNDKEYNISAAGEKNQWEAGIAGHAYYIADAMLAEREKAAAEPV